MSEPITREEMFLAKAAGEDVNVPAPITRREKYLAKIAENGGGGGGGGSSGTMIVHTDQTGTLDKTWQEIFDAMANGTSVYIGGASETAVRYSALVISAVNDDGFYYLDIFDFTANSSSDSAFATDSADGYPVYNG